MRRIYEIPVLGYMMQILALLIKLPRKLCEVQKEISDLKAQIEEQRGIIEKQRTKQEEIEIVVSKWNKGDFTEKVERVLNQEDFLERLNVLLSTHLTIWGDRKRAHISSLAAVSSCFLNVNSGEITIGDYTFAGSNVSILAGSHDMHLEGLIRRDAELKQGCDIKIGKGVWLASGCTILGPCSIGDNAVIAAGAVITPGTIVPENGLYAGIPAKMIRKLSTDMQIDHSPIIFAIKREKGVLFVSGWSEKTVFSYKENLVQGHWIVESSAKIYTSRKKLRMLFVKGEIDSAEVSIRQDTNEWHFVLDNIENEYFIEINENQNEIAELNVNYDVSEKIKLFVAVLEEDIQNQ